MDKMDKNSQPYKEGSFRELFESAESTMMAAEDVVLYSQSLERMREVEAGMYYRYEQGRAEGREEGKKSLMKSLIDKFRKAGMSIPEIAQLLESDEASIEGLLS